MSKISGASRLTGFDKPTVWSIMTPLAVRTKSVNLGQGFPSWAPPDFYLKNLEMATKEAHHQYTRAFGSMDLVQAIAAYHKHRFPGLNPQTEILTTNGGVEALFCSILGLVDEGDEVIFLDPSYDCYRSQIQLAGGKSIGIPLKPKMQQTKAMIQQRCAGKYAANENDDWVIDFEALEKAFTERTKMFIFNSPHNPVGKVFTHQEVARIGEIIKKYPRVTAVEDNVYEGMTFDDMFEKPLPKLALHPGLEDRTLSVYSGGKIFSATGVRSGWVFGNSALINCVRSIHQYGVFCAYNVTQLTITKCLQEISQPESTYMRDYALRLTKNRNMLIDELIASKFDFDIWIPKGGYFLIADISRVKIDEKYMKDENGKLRTRDYAFCIQFAHEEGVVAVPCSSFYAQSESHLGEKYVRFAFCKEEDMIREAGKRMR